MPRSLEVVGAAIYREALGGSLYNICTTIVVLGSPGGPIGITAGQVPLILLSQKGVPLGGDLMAGGLTCFSGNREPPHYDDLGK